MQVRECNQPAKINHTLITHNMNNTNDNINLSDNEDNSTNNFFLTGRVVSGGIPTIPERFDVLCKERAITFADFYNAIGLDKSYASKIRRGLIVPPLFLRIRIAEYFRIDTSVIWQFPEIVRADQMEEKKK